MAFTLHYETITLAKTYGIERLGFLTLTFADHVVSIKEAQKRFHSLNTHIIKKRYERAVGVWERQKSGRIHFHLLVVLSADIRTGANFEAFERGDYRSANKLLRSEWAFWRTTAPKYRFGRTELLPVKSTADGIARYVGKYVRKHIEQREERDKGARIIRFIGFQPGTRSCYSSFAWNTSKAWLWRHKLKAWAEFQGMKTMDQLKELFGPRWAYHFQDAIMAVRIDEVCPNRTTAERNSNDSNTRTFDRQGRYEAAMRGRAGKDYTIRPDFKSQHVASVSQLGHEPLSTSTGEPCGSGAQTESDTAKGGQPVSKGARLCSVVHRCQPNQPTKRFPAFLWTTFKC